jgi:hypothetical protein
MVLEHRRRFDDDGAHRVAPVIAEGDQEVGMQPVGIIFPED